MKFVQILTFLIVSAIVVLLLLYQPVRYVEKVQYAIYWDTVKVVQVIPHYKDKDLLLIKRLLRERDSLRRILANYSVKVIVTVDTVIQRDTILVRYDEISRRLYTNISLGEREYKIKQEECSFWEKLGYVGIGAVLGIGIGIAGGVVK